MVSTHDTCNLSQLLEKNLCDHTPISMSKSDIGSLNQSPNPIEEQTITDPSSHTIHMEGIPVLKQTSLENGSFVRSAKLMFSREDNM